MKSDEPKFWPYPILKPESEWTEFDRHFIEFMQTAFAEGYRPRDYLEWHIEAGHEEGRFISLVFRGKTHGWEPFLNDSGNAFRLGPYLELPLSQTACVCVRPPFRSAAHLALEWMRGRSLHSILQSFQFVDGSPPGILLRQQSADGLIPT
ncbi:MAG TPA: hypothetical protein VGJ15_09245, partial [Pirellulales bacterium]